MDKAQTSKDTILVTESYPALGGWFLAYAAGTLEWIQGYQDREVDKEFGLNLINVPKGTESYYKAATLKPGDIVNNVETGKTLTLSENSKVIGKARIRN